ASVKAKWTPRSLADKRGEQKARPIGSLKLCGAAGSVGGHRSFLIDYGVDVDTQALRHARSVGRIGFVEVLDLQLLDVPRHAAAQAAHYVADQPSLCVRRH